MNDSNGPRSVSQRDLPVLGEPRPERADARRNRLKVLEAADRLFAERGVKNISLDAIAAEAGVGKGTVFRRFGDRAGLAVALLDERERELQERILTGPPPLGPGAPAVDRLTAFVDAYLELLDRHVELFIDSENASDGARYRIGSYWLWHRHVVLLVEEARPELDAAYVAHAVLAPLAADLHQALRSEGFDLDRMRTGLKSVVELLLRRP
ncbi:TetR/AcrR family transcriptional regulator [Kribbella italica]|uniref:AcrR family transcriptional regulator n=1 Tax=Kribbella italica TaxID=1540520 RepID=A0A7W9J8B9_9ACTN|nr:TetR/AcrR family transcriptional regulator [Kribbella italica]MBB5837491.1 AcrR family transcriptional regulator [Kribbella italica]